ncbi:MAG: hypothetical protein ACXAC8_14270 [Candidatus Hodarchaeales archaeon]|jgi:rRNA small subunit pseudouridine methyltransferase Nep1
MTINIIFFECALELIPEQLRTHRLIRNKWRMSEKKNRGILLDGAIHRSLMSLLDSPEKRGRPDILHHSLINLVYSPLFIEEKIKIFLHTRNDLCIQIPSKWRIPVNYNRFCGLFSQLLLKKRVPISNEPLLTAKTCSLKNFLQKFKDSIFYICELPNENWEKNRIVDNFVNITEHSSITFLLGGFQHGIPELQLSNQIFRDKDMFVLSFYDEIKPVWIIASKIIQKLEDSYTLWQ